MRHRVPDLGPLIPAQLGHHALFAISVAALAGAGLRAASLAAPAGLDRVVAAVSLAAAAAVIEALALGLAGLGTHPLAATATAVATWVVARRWLPVPDRALRSEFANWWRGAGAPKRLVVGTVVGLVLAMVAWSLDSPDVGIDGTYYHLPEIVAWVHNGRPGSIEEVTYVYPVGNFPATNEIVLAWSLGLSRSFVPIALWTPFMLALVVAAGWLGLRSLRVPTLPAALAIAAVCSLPAMIDQLNGPLNDVPALAWLVSAAALSAASASRPALLAPAAVAAGLSAGTKTTTLPLAALVLVLGLIAHRRRLRGLALPLGLAAVAALIVGGTSYVRNLVDHGSPFWPWGAAPWGDPAPTFIDETFYSLLERPGATLEGRVDRFAERLAGGILLLGAGLLVPLVSRRRAVTASALTAAVMTLLWVGAPTTGITDDPVFDASLSNTRYLVPAIAAAALALGLAARGRGPVATGATVTLGAALAWNVVEDAGGVFPHAPSPLTLLTGAAFGVLGAALLPNRLLPQRLPTRSRSVGAGLAAVSVIVGATLLAATAPGYTERYAQNGRFFDVELVRWFANRAEFEDDGRPIAMAPELTGILTGDRLQRELELIPRNEPCARVERRAQRGWVVLREDGFLRSSLGFTSGRCLARARPVRRVGAYRVYPPGD